MSTSVPAVYLHVVESVVSKLREEFLNEGVDDTVLAELQALWELKMMQCGAIQGPVERSFAPRNSIPTAVHDLNVPYEGTEEYETPTAEMLFPPTPLQTPIQTPLPIEPAVYQYFPPGQSEYGSVPDIGSAAEIMTGRPAPYMQRPSPWMNQRPLGVDVNVAYEEERDVEEGGVPQPAMKDFFTMTNGKRKREDYTSRFLPGGCIPQQDGSGDVTSDHSCQGKILNPKHWLNKEHWETITERLRLQERKNADLVLASLNKTEQTATIPQNDGLHDVYDDGASNEDYNTPSSYDPMTVHNLPTPRPTKSGEAEDDEPPLNEDDDDDLDDLEQGDDESSTNHLVLAQFEKVTRTKSRWKCTLKDGIMHLNNKDILFTKATGEFDF